MKMKPVKKELKLTESSPENGVIIHHSAYTLESVMYYFIDGFKIPDELKLASSNWWIDTTKGEVMFQITLKSKS